MIIWSRDVLSVLRSSAKTRFLLEDVNQNLPQYFVFRDEVFEAEMSQPTRSPPCSGEQCCRRLRFSWDVQGIALRRADRGLRAAY